MYLWLWHRSESKKVRGRMLVTKTNIQVQSQTLAPASLRPNFPMSWEQNSSFHVKLRLVSQSYLCLRETMRGINLRQIAPLSQMFQQSLSALWNWNMLNWWNLFPINNSLCKSLNNIHARSQSAPRKTRDLLCKHRVHRRQQWRLILTFRAFHTEVRCRVISGVRKGEGGREGW